ncbi:MAG: hypothetical protein JNL10_17970 [Verrucomicrobiales bacterium]|nr:hypothetical protein [Verrucomicrobiales bacterium]
MKSFLVVAIAAVSFVLQPPIRADIVVPGANGRDGVFAPVSNIEVDLSQAITATWDSTTESGGRGVYDPAKWAVVFRYASVNIPEGVTVTFKNHPTRAPVVWLVSGDASIGGRVLLDGKDDSSLNPVEPGPGGFRGGRGGNTSSTPGGGGMGPGGGKPTPDAATPSGASHSIRGSTYSGPAYGDNGIRRLMGGSGGGGILTADGSGGGGGGAILIAAQGTLNLTGLIRANGGIGRVGGGSGGAIRMIANSFTGAGTLRAIGTPSRGVLFDGQPGYIHASSPGLEGEILGNIASQPSATTESLSGTVELWPDESFPQARILSVADLPVAADPAAALAPQAPDVSLPPAAHHTVVIETRNFPPTGTVTLFVTALRGDRTEVIASHTSGNETVSTWTATLSGVTGRHALQVRAVAP